MGAFGLEAYLFEPNYFEELRIREAEAKNTTSTKDLAQTENTDDSDTASSTSSARDSEEWCLCGHCTVMPTKLENVCCHKVFAERHKLTEGMCLKETEEFSVAYHQFTLELAFAQFLRYKRQNA
ncbi:hypothetical protein HOLleu_18100 [Holothuria leucospilota]|uniref:P2X purinoreceptor 7 intracellular domain-containing protein n=1 Tax=Holothuria leucospilota TaxID=206669 RepID=A0A9Q1C3H7_HOLLE|nr:hypothetical protein HOLleu_18100 [Holothuria leucospilota]